MASEGVQQFGQALVPPLFGRAAIAKISAVITIPSASYSAMKREVDDIKILCIVSEILKLIFEP
jgi:hypothetical protein